MDRIQQGDYRDLLDARAGQFAAVTATDVLEHLTKAEVLDSFDRVARALIPGNIFVARLPNAASPFGGGFATATSRRSLPIPLAASARSPRRRACRGHCSALCAGCTWHAELCSGSGVEASEHVLQARACGGNEHAPGPYRHAEPDIGVHKGHISEVESPISGGDDYLVPVRPRV